MSYLGIGGSGIQDIMGDVQAIKGQPPAQKQGPSLLDSAMAQRYTPQVGRADRLSANIYTSPEFQ